MENRDDITPGGLAGESGGGARRSDAPTIPPEVERVFREFRTCEFSTMTRSGVPVAWPLIALWRPDEGRFVLTTSIGLTMKAFNIRRNPKVSLLFSDPTASGIENPPAVLVQGDAEVTEEIKTSPAGFEDYWERIFRIQPAGKMYGANALMRYLMDMYYSASLFSSGLAASCGGRTATSSKLQTK
jgi:general stress protein 26